MNIFSLTLKTEPGAIQLVGNKIIIIGSPRLTVTTGIGNLVVSHGSHTTGPIFLRFFVVVIK